MEAFRAEWVETLGIALAEEGGISLLSTEPLDVDPGDRKQPLSFIGYHGFQDWLEEAHLDEFQRLVDPGTPGSINGVAIEFGMAPQNPDLVDDFTALIDLYLASR